MARAAVARCTEAVAVRCRSRVPAMLACISRRLAGRSYVTRGRTRRTSARGSSSPITGQEQGRRALAARDFAPGGSVSAGFGLRPVPGGEVLHAGQAASRQELVAQDQDLCGLLSLLTPGEPQPRR